MAQKTIPGTSALRFLRDHRVLLTHHTYAYVEHGGTAHAAAELGVDEHTVIKTLVFRTDAGAPLLVLMHGDREVSTKQLARILGVKAVAPADPGAVQRLTGCMVGGVSPFGTRTPLRVYAEETIFALPLVYINGGRRGLLVSIAPEAIERTLGATRVAVGLAERARENRSGD